MESWTAGLKITAAEVIANTERYTQRRFVLDGRERGARDGRRAAMALLTAEERDNVREWGIIPAAVFVDTACGEDIVLVLFRAACPKCDGSGYLPEHAGVDGGRCWGCFKSGYASGRRSTVRTYQEFARLAARNAAARARREEARQAEAAAHVAKVAAERAAWRAQDDHDAVLTGLATLGTGDGSRADLARDLLRQFEVLAQLTTGQLGLARKIIAEAAAEAAAVASGAELPEGRYEVTGTVTWSRIEDNEVWAGRWVVRTSHRIGVETAEGYKVWLNVPGDAFGTVDRGDRVAVTVTVTRSKRSQLEGNGSRPSKFRKLDAPEAATAA